MKRLLLALMALAAGCSYGQTFYGAPGPSMALVTATAIVDASDAPLASGTICFTPVDANGRPTPFTISGGGNVRAVNVCRPVLAGVMTNPALYLARSDESIPIGVNYQITVTDASTGMKQTLGIAAIAASTWSLNTWAPSSVVTAPPAAWVLGPQGPAATITIGSVTTLAPGASATATNSGTASAAILNLGIPAGATGTGAANFPTASAGGMALLSAGASNTYTPTALTPAMIGALSTGGGTLTGMLAFSSGGISIPLGSMSSASAEVGSQATVGTAYLDLHSDGSSTDYNVRIQSTGGTPGVTGSGNATVLANSLALPPATTIGGNTPVNQANAISKLPTVSVQHPDFAGGADPTGVNDTHDAIMAAYAFSLTQRVAGSTIPPVLKFGPGVFKLSQALEFTSGNPCPILYSEGAIGQVAVLAPVAGATAVVFNGCTSGTGGPASAEGGMMGVGVHGTGHSSTGDGVDVFFSQNLFFQNVSVANMGGTGMVFLGSAERNNPDNIELRNNRVGVVVVGNANENFLEHTRLMSNGVDEAGFSYNVNANLPGCTTAGTCGVFPASGPLLSDPHAAAVIDGTQNVRISGSSVKGTLHEGGFKIVGADEAKVSDPYCEGFVNGAINPCVQVFGKTEIGHLTSALSTTATSFSVDDASYREQHAGSCTDAAALAAYIANSGNGQFSYYANTYVVAPPDFVAGSTATSSIGGGILKGSTETIQVGAFCTTTASSSTTLGGQGTAYIAAASGYGTGRGLNGTTALSWPAGALYYQIVAPSSTVRIQGAHVNSTYQLQPPYTQALCSDTALQAPGSWLYSPSEICGEVLLSAAIDGLAITAPNQAGAAIAYLDNNEFFYDTPTGVGYVTVGSSPGSGYVVGDVVTIAGTNGGSASVKSIGSGGSVTGVARYAQGSYASVGTNLATTGGTGTGLTINVVSLGETLGAGLIKCASNCDVLDYDIGSLGMPNVAYGAATFGFPNPATATKQVTQSWANIVAVTTAGVTANMHYYNIPLGIEASPQDNVFIRQSRENGFEGIDALGGYYINDIGPNGCPTQQFLSRGYPAAYPALQYNVNNGTACGLATGWQLLPQSGGTANESLSGNQSVTGNSTIGGSSSIGGNQTVAGTHTVSGSIIPAGGIANSIIQYSSAATQTPGCGTRYGLYGDSSDGLVITLPSGCLAGTVVGIGFNSTTSQKTIAAPSGSIYINAWTQGSSFVTRYGGRLELMWDGFNWGNVSYLPEIANVMIAAGSAFGTNSGAVVPSPNLNTASSAQFTLTSTAAGTSPASAAQTAFTFAFSPTLATAPQSCHVQWTSAAAIAAQLDLVPSQPTTSGLSIVVPQGGTALPSGTYSGNLQCQ